MPFLVRFLLRHALIGGAIAAVFVGTLTMLDVFGLGTLLTSSEDGLLALAVLTFALGLTFGSVQMGFAVMLMSDSDDTTRGKAAPVRRLIASPVRISARR